MVRRHREVGGETRRSLVYRDVRVVRPPLLPPLCVVGKPMFFFDENRGYFSIRTEVIFR